MSDEAGNPYPGPRPFLVSDARYFVGRERERGDLEDLLFAYRAVLLYAQSGTGKSSLVHAGLLAGFDKSRYALARVSGDEPPAAFGGINAHTYAVLRSIGHDIDPGGPKTLASTLARAVEEPWFLVLDQFEELFTAYPHRWQEREPFFIEIRALLDADPSARVLFVMREEFVADLDRYRSYVPQKFEIRYRLERLRRSESLRAIREPAARSGEPERAKRMDELAERLADSLLTVPVETRTGVQKITGEYVEPLHLQVVCRELWPKLGKDSKVNARELADVDRVLSAYYERAIRKAATWKPWREARMRNWFDRALITPAGTRGIVYMDAARKEAAGMSSADVRTFESERLIRPEVRAGSTWYELTHDRFIAPIRRSNQSWRQRRRVRIGLMAALAIGLGVASLSIYQVAAKRRIEAELQREQDQARSATTRAESAVKLAAAAADPNESPEDRATALALLAGNEVQAGNMARAITLLGSALKLSPSRAGQAFANPGNTSGDWKVMSGRVFREALAKFDAEIGSHQPLDPELLDFICKHNFYIIGASANIADAENELKRRWRPLYPHAQLGIAQPELGKTPIVFDYFLTCEEARALAADVQAKYRSEPVIKSWYTELRCARCPPRVSSSGQ